MHRHIKAITAEDTRDSKPRLITVSSMISIIKQSQYCKRDTILACLYSFGRRGDFQIPDLCSSLDYVVSFILSAKFLDPQTRYSLPQACLAINIGNCIPNCLRTQPCFHIDYLLLDSHSYQKSFVKNSTVAMNICSTSYN